MIAIATAASAAAMIGCIVIAIKSTGKPTPSVEGMKIQLPEDIHRQTAIPEQVKETL